MGCAQPAKTCLLCGQFVEDEENGSSTQAERGREKAVRRSSRFSSVRNVFRLYGCTDDMPGTSTQVDTGREEARRRSSRFSVVSIRLPAFMVRFKVPKVEVSQYVEMPLSRQERQEGTLLIRNRENASVFFKLKATNKKAIVTVPKEGKLAPWNGIVIQIRFFPRGDVSNVSLLVEAVRADKHIGDCLTKEEWSEIPDEVIYRREIPVIHVGGPNPDPRPLLRKESFDPGFRPPFRKDSFDPFQCSVYRKLSTDPDVRSMRHRVSFDPDSRPVTRKVSFEPACTPSHLTVPSRAEAESTYGTDLRVPEATPPNVSEAEERPPAETPRAFQSTMVVRLATNSQQLRAQLSAQ